MAKTFVFERFPSIYAFMETIDKRPDEKHFRTESTDTDNPEWYGTKDYPEALEKLANGMPEKAKMLEASLRNIKAKSAQTVTKSRIQRNYYGYAPNVPAALAGVPKAMKYRERVPHKTKTIHIWFNRCALGSVSAETLDKSGCVTLALVYLLEQAGYRVKLEIMVSATDCDRCGDLFCNVLVKDFRQPLDVLKLSFPLVNPSMFRRFGFKWKETCPNLPAGSSEPNYGRSYTKPDMLALLKRKNVPLDNVYIIDWRDCKESGFDAVKLAKHLEITL